MIVTACGSNVCRDGYRVKMTVIVTARSGGGCGGDSEGGGGDGL